jgi:Cu/Ag efflux protein CusF
MSRVAQNNQLVSAGVLSATSGANSDSWPQGERKMKISSSMLCVSLLAQTTSFALAQEAQRGTVVGVDEQAGSITVQRSPDGTVGASSPARSSDKFAVQDGLMFNALGAGDNVLFSSQEINGVNTITRLQKE